MILVKNKFLLGCLIILISFAACRNEEDEAINSIRGSWEVTNITSSYGHFRENGWTSSETISEMGELGRFEFSEDSVAFEFTRNDTLYTGNDAWSLTTERVNAGFAKVTVYTLIIDNHFILDVEFEDGTKNSERNAENVNFIETPEIGFGVLIEFELDKQ